MVKREILQRLTVILGVTAFIFVNGCSSAKKVDDGGGVPSAPEAVDNSTLGDSDSGKALGLQTVHFLYDSSTLDPQAKSVLASNADLLKSKPGVRIQIEGHCDQRGGIQYNIALGERRANATRKYLMAQGIDGSRMTVISFGKEKPIDFGATEEAYAQNRRSNFVITSQ